MDRLSDVVEVDTRLSDVIAAYLEAVDAGWAPAREELMRRYPELATELSRFFAHQDHISRLAEPATSRAVSPPKVDRADTPAGTEPPTLPMPTPASTPTLDEPSAFDGYELLGEIKRGGMGIVYKARQKRLNRLVALKVILAGPGASPAEVHRFRNEAEQAAHLDHPNIVPIYEVGDHAGAPFFSMKLFEGGSLTDHLDRLTHDQVTAARLLATVARAVHHAHERGILHRDLKPANILLDPQGQPHVGDFGLAKRLPAEEVPGALEHASKVPASGHVENMPHSPWAGVPSREDSATLSDARAPGITQAGMIVGTPAYMAPEQAAGTKTLTIAADIYGLGAVLYRLLTGRPPFHGGTARETLSLVHEQALTPPRTLSPTLNPRLEAICLKCLAKDPRARYASAAALAEDLERWLRGEPPLAWSKPWYLRAWHASRRYVLVGAITAVLGFGVALAYLVSYYADPDRPVKDLEARLADGRAVTLVGPTGPPAWFRWSSGEDVALASKSKDEPLSISTLVAGQMKLLSSPRTSRYRFRAEIRHEEAAAASVVGLYFGFTTIPNRDGVAHYWCDLLFSERGANARMDRELGADKKPTGREGFSRVQLELNRLPEPFTEFRHMTVFDAFKTFLPSNDNNHVWRKLAVEVRPETIHPFWEGAPIVPNGIAVPKLEATANLFSPVDPKDRSVQFAFAPTGALGLYVSRGKASFRNVAVEPLK